MLEFRPFIHISWIVLSTLREIDINGGYSHTCEQFTLLTGNQVVSTMFDFNAFNRMDRIILVQEVEIKTLDLVSTIQAARNFFYSFVQWTIHKQMAASILCLYISILLMYSKSFLYQNSLN